MSFLFGVFLASPGTVSAGSYRAFTPKISVGRECITISPQRLRHHTARPLERRGLTRWPSATTAVQDQVQLVQQDGIGADLEKPILVYLPGTDGTGNALRPQLASLLGAGFDVRTLYIPITNRSTWEELQSETISKLQQIAGSGKRKVILVAESFGGCLGLRVAKAAPLLVERMVLVNPATSFARSYARLPSLVAATGLLSIFPEQLYQVAQAVLVPFLVDKEKVGPAGLQAIRAMMMMQRPDAPQVDEGGMAEQPNFSQQDLGSLTSFLPSATASWRLRLLNSGGMSDLDLSSIRVPTLVVASAGDKLLPSLSESTRLQRLMPQCQRVVLPESGHTALLELCSLLLASLLMLSVTSWTSLQAQLCRLKSETERRLCNLLHRRWPITAALGAPCLFHGQLHQFAASPQAPHPRLGPSFVHVEPKCMFA